MIAAAALALLPLVSAYSKTFVVPHVDGKDDSPAVIAALANYSSDSLILFQKGVTYNLWTPINFGSLTNSEVAFEGNATYPTSIAAVQAEVAKSVHLSRTLAQNQRHKRHAPRYHRSQLGLDRLARPTMVGRRPADEPPTWDPVQRDQWRDKGYETMAAYRLELCVEREQECSCAFPFNTDGFGAGGTNLLYENNHIANGDDCITVGNGSNGVHFRNNYCEGGHGMSIGSLGSGGSVASVQNVLFENVVMKNHLYGARFKSWTGGNGVARNITWRNIVLENVPFPIFVTQNYWDQNVSPCLGPKPSTGAVNNTHIEDMLFDNFSGSQLDTPYVEGSCVSDPCWYAVANATGKEIAIFDLYPNTTSNILARHISGIKPVNGAQPAVMCDPATVDNDVGFVCQDGAFVPTKVGYTR
ncbi:glycoside hydrolase family 28 protein [Rhizoctonia solani AG-1 IA]|uniref:galacturonan 1,4-alpha-galacturonidase n=1 Tax=Thanatephorus cucumeris (strain AG1-IA) TaxID=983506 RepID=L8X570_THACA|nr:glycoside hydrolase family 28 protein [Rhizoctonia solani AG-1 IA]